MKEVVKYMPEIKGYVQRGDELPFKEGDCVDTEEEAREIETAYQMQSLSEGFYHRYDDILKALSKKANENTIDRWIDKIIAFIEQETM